MSDNGQPQSQRYKFLIDNYLIGGPNDVIRHELPNPESLLYRYWQVTIVNIKEDDITKAKGIHTEIKALCSAYIKLNDSGYSYPERDKEEVNMLVKEFITHILDDAVNHRNLAAIQFCLKYGYIDIADLFGNIVPLYVDSNFEVIRYLNEHDHPEDWKIFTTLIDHIAENNIDSNDLYKDFLARLEEDKQEEAVKYASEHRPPSEI